MAASEKNHPYHIVEPSPWPFVGSIAAFVAATGLVLYMHDYGFIVLLMGVILVFFTMFGWWRDVIKESEDVTYYTPPVEFGLRIGIVLFIASELMFFAAFFWAFFNASLFPTEPTGGTWPPKGINPINPFDLPYFNTLILLLSATAVTWAHHALLAGRRKEVLQGLAATIFLGLLFTCVQAYEYVHASFTFKEGIYASTFYMATGFHGAHVIVGTIFLIVCWFVAYFDLFTEDRHIGLEAAAWYWHFVDVVWLFLFVCIYWWGSGL